MFIPLVSFGQSSSNDGPIFITGDYADILLNKRDGTLFTNNNRSIMDWEVNDLSPYITKIRRNCKKAWCQLLILNDDDYRDDYEENVYSIYYSETIGYVLYNFKNGASYVANHGSISWRSKIIQDIMNEKGGEIPHFWKTIINCPEGEWCRVNK